MPGSLAPPPPLPPPPLPAAQLPTTTPGQPIARLRRREPENSHSNEKLVSTHNALLPQTATIGPVKVTDGAGKFIGGLGGLRRSHTYYPTGTLALGTGVHSGEHEATAGNHPAPIRPGTNKNGESSLQMEDARIEAQKVLKHTPSRTATATAAGTIPNALYFTDSISATKRPIYQSDHATRPVSRTTPSRKGKELTEEFGLSQAKRRKLSQLVVAVNAVSSTPVTLVPQVQAQAAKEDLGAQYMVRGPNRYKKKLQERPNTETWLGKEGEDQGKEKDLMEEISHAFNSEQVQELEKTVVQEQQEGGIEEVENEDGHDKSYEERAGSVTSGTVREISAANKDQLSPPPASSIISQSRHTRRSLPTKLPNNTVPKPLISPNSPEARGDARNVTPPSWVRPVRVKAGLESTQMPNARMLTSAPSSPEHITPQRRPTRENKTPAKSLPRKFSSAAKGPHYSSRPEKGSIIIEGGRRSSYRVSKAPREWWVVDAAPTINTGLTKTRSMERGVQKKRSLVEQRGERKAEVMKSTRRGESEAHESQAKEDIGNRSKKTGVRSANTEVRQRSTSRGRSTTQVARRQLQSVSISPIAQPPVQPQPSSPITPRPVSLPPRRRRKAKDFDLDDEVESQLQMELKHKHNGQENSPLRSPPPPPLTHTHIPSAIVTTEPKPVLNKPIKAPFQVRPKSILGKACPLPPTTKARGGKRAHENASANGTSIKRRTKHEVEHADYEFSD